MKVRDIMTKDVIRIDAAENVEVAARTLARHNIGILPVCDGNGKVCGLVTDRDIVTRCLASGRDPGSTAVRDVMTGQVTSVQPDMEAGVAAHLMGRKQVRRLPVMENGKLCGMLSLGDLTKQEENIMDAADALTDITDNLSSGSGW